MEVISKLQCNNLYYRGRFGAAGELFACTSSWQLPGLPLEGNADCLLLSEVLLHGFLEKKCSSRHSLSILLSDRLNLLTSEVPPSSKLLRDAWIAIVQKKQTILPPKFKCLITWSHQEACYSQTLLRSNSAWPKLNFSPRSNFYWLYQTLIDCIEPLATRVSLCWLDS